MSDFTVVDLCMPLPIAVALSPLFSFFAGWLARFLGSWLLMGIFAFVSELLPRLFGLGQGLLSWGFGVFASAAFSAFTSSLSLAGVSVPSFAVLLANLPPSFLWAGSALHVKQIVFIFVSIPIVKLLRKVAERVASTASSTAASSLLTGGK